MATVPNATTQRKPRAFYAQYLGLSGVITRPAAAVLFLEPASGAVVTLTDADSAELVVLGSVEEAMAQYCEDMARGGYAAVACTRSQEVR